MTSALPPLPLAARYLAALATAATARGAITLALQFQAAADSLPPDISALSDAALATYATRIIDSDRGLFLPDTPSTRPLLAPHLFGTSSMSPPHRRRPQAA